MEVKGLARACVCKNISPQQELFTKGQVRGRLSNKTGFVSLCQLLSATGALQKQLLFSKADISEPHAALVLVSLRATALPSLSRGRNTCRRYCLIGIKTKVKNQNSSASSAAPSSSLATHHFCKAFSQCNNCVELSVAA